jgi:cytochrome c oxidase subunit 2
MRHVATSRKEKRFSQTGNAPFLWSSKRAGTSNAGARTPGHFAILRMRLSPAISLPRVCRPTRDHPAAVAPLVAVVMPGSALAQQVAQPAAAHSALAAAGVQAARIGALWNLTLIVCTLVFAAVLIAVLVVLARAPRGDARTKAVAGRAAMPGDGLARRYVIGATALSVLLLVGLVVADVLTDRALSRLPSTDALHVEMTGAQWWWQARYATDHGQPGFVVANELHVPVGRPVIVSLKAADVIHTFWVPNLHGKKDMLPGIDSTIEFRADRPGLYRGQCAEFCGAEHALMALFVTADEPADYARWSAHQRADAAPPASPLALRGRQLFEAADCAQCHTVRGTSATGQIGPDLTHLMSRRTIAAGTLVNDRANLEAWLRNPQQFKPETSMPAAKFSATDLETVVTWLTTLN